MISLLQETFVQRALIAGGLLSIPLGLLGCFVLWRRIVFFSDAMGHAALLGVVAGAMVNLPIQLGILFISLAVAYCLSKYKEGGILPFDTWLGCVSYGGLSLGLLLLSTRPDLRINPEAILFGDILTITWQDVWVILGVVIFASFLVYKNWRALILLSINEDMARSSGINVRRVQLLFLTLIAITTAVGLKVVGGLLLPALLIFSAASAVRFSSSPESMAIWSCGLALLIFLLGMMISFLFDMPSGPSIVVTGLGVLLISSAIKK